MIRQYYSFWGRHTVNPSLLLFIYTVAYNIYIPTYNIILSYLPPQPWLFYIEYLAPIYLNTYTLSFFFSLPAQSPIYLYLHTIDPAFSSGHQNKVCLSLLFTQKQRQYSAPPYSLFIGRPILAFAFVFYLDSVTHRDHHDIKWWWGGDNKKTPLQ